MTSKRSEAERKKQQELDSKQSEKSLTYFDFVPPKPAQKPKSMIASTPKPMDNYTISKKPQATMPKNLGAIKKSQTLSKTSGQNDPSTGRLMPQNMHLEGLSHYNSIAQKKNAAEIFEQVFHDLDGILDIQYGYENYKFFNPIAE